MEIYVNDISVSNLLEKRSFYDVYPEMNLEREFSIETLNEYFATEGLIWDTAKTAYNIGKAAGKAGKKVYKSGKKSYRKLKDKWSKIRPLIIKAIKDLGITLTNMWGKFMHYDKDYADLAKKIDNVINVKVPLLGQTKTTVYIDMYNLDVNTLSNVCKLVESYEGFVSIVKNEKSLLGGSFIEPEDFYNLIKKNCNRRTGEFNSKNVEYDLNRMISAVGTLNERGEITIPNTIWTSRKMYVPTNIPFMKKRNERKNFQENLDKSTAAGFTRASITGQMTELTFDPGSLSKLKDLLVKGNNTGYLQLMKSFLTNKIIENTLKKSGSSLKNETRKYFSEMDKFSVELDSLQNEMENAKNKNNANKSIDNTIDPSNEEDIKNKTLKNSDDGMTSEMDNSLEILIENYMECITNFYMNMSSIYKSMVQGLLAGSFDLIMNCKTIVDKIESIINLPKDKKVGAN